MTSGSDSSSSSGARGRVAGGDGRRPTTLRPPEWGESRASPVSAATLAMELHEADPPVSRRTGPRAELAHFHSRVRSAAASGDVETEREASAALARALVTRGTELDTATRLARRALIIGHDPILREELSTWFAALGEPALAAATLRPLVAELSGPAAARVLTRIGVLLGRAGDAAGAADALFDAAREDPSDAVAPELQAGIGAWAPSAVSPERAAEGYLEGFRRWEAAGDRAAAFEDLLRAFEMAPGEPHPAERLAGALAIRGRVGAADEVLREHARASDERGRTVHLKRIREAAAAGDLPRAIGAAFDARLEADLADAARSERGPSFQALAERAGLHELVAARLELAAEQRSGAERAALRVELARLFAGPLASPDRALDAWVDALVSDPRNQEARAALASEIADTGDASAMVTALMRIAVGATEPGQRKQALAELATLADERLNDPGLAVWAARRALAISADPALSALGERLEPEAEAQAREIDAAKKRCEEASGAERSAALAALAALLRGRPDRADEYVRVLSELSERAPEDSSPERALERVLLREGHFEELERAIERALERGSADEDRLRNALSMLRRRRGDADGALAALVPLVEATGAHAAGVAMAALLATNRGVEKIRAQALLRLAGPLSPSLRAVLLAVAAESLLSAGDVAAARAYAEQANRTDPSQARPVGVLAAVALAGKPDRFVAEALERAMGFIVPRAALCEALAVAHEALNEPVLALVWTQRWLTLRPGDPHAARTLLGRVTESGDAQRIGDALAWLLSQPEPLGDLASPLGAALLRLAELDAARGVAMARRALDVIGPKAEELRQTVTSIADAAGEPGLAIAVQERVLATGASQAERIELLLEIAARRKVAGDADGAARALARAVREGAPSRRILDELGEALPARSSDGELCLLEARAEALARMPEADGEAAARAFRELGAALWDLAGDTEGAMLAWERAAVLDPARGIARLARDMVSFGGAEPALARLEAFAERQSSVADRARLLGISATVALGAGAEEAALRIAARALELDPSQSDVVAVAERAAKPGDVDTLEQIYTRMSAAALGVYGERALHYRAARQFERRGDIPRALEHAVRAFEAVPAEGVTFVLMSRLAERAGQSARVVRTLERVADAAVGSTARADWLRRAAILGGSDEESLRLRVDILLRALMVRPDSALLSALGSTLSELSRVSPEYREIAELRLEHALDALLAHVEGPEGARVALKAAEIALDANLLSLADRALGCAVECDADIDEYAGLARHAGTLARERAMARALVARVVALSGDRMANAGRALLELMATVARNIDDSRSAAELLVAAAVRDPDDAELAHRAALAAQLAGDAALLDRIAGAVPTAERIGSLLQMAAGAEKGGDLSLAVEALQRVASDPLAPEKDRRSARVRLRELYARVGRNDELEALLEADVARGDLAGAALSRAARDLAALLTARGKLARGLEVLTETLHALPDDVGLLEDLASLAAQAREPKRRAAALSQLADLVAGADRIRALRDLAPLLEELGDESAAQRWAELSSLVPNDVEALAALERDAEKRGDYERAAALLARRAALANRVDEVRRVRLRRATLLEERLGRADEARVELEALLSATGDNLGVLRVLADLHERLGAPLRAAPLWMRASAITEDRAEAADLTRRACEAYLAGGDVDAARRVLDGMEAWARSERLLELRVDVEQKSGDPRALAAAIEELTDDSARDPGQNAALLVDAARAHERAGDLADALAAAERAAELEPRRADAQILVRWLEYRVRGPSSREHARLVVAALRAIEQPVSSDEAELRGFLVAEALDRAVGAGAGMRELSKLNSEIGTLPLIALGIAERLAEGGEFAGALPLFDVALAGNLHDVRSRGRLAITAADAARHAGDLQRAQAYVELAAAEPVTRQPALALQGQLRAEQLALEMARERAAERAAEPPEPPPRAAEPPPEPREALYPGPRESDPRLRRVSERPPAPRASERPPARASEPPPRHLSEHPPPLQATTYHSTAPPDVIAHRLPSAVPPERASQRAVPPNRNIPISEVGPEPRVDMPPSMRRVSGTFPAASAMESELAAELAAGSLDAGRELVRQLENRRSRAHDLVAVCRRLVALAPGDRKLLRQLYDATLSDRNHVYARAVEHVLALFDPSVEPVSPPPLGDQPEDPQRVRALLARELAGPAAEALALVWDNAAHVFRRDPSTYGVTGVERVPPGAPSPLARAYTAASRVLGLGRTPLFQKKNFGSITLGVALLSPPAVITSGEIARETPELSYHLGAMLFATLAENVLLFGCPEEQVRTVLKALLLAFGPPEQHRPHVASAASLAEVLWERIPARAQRRLRELCHDPEGFGYGVAQAIARMAIRRAGLFVCGDLGVALRETCRMEGIPIESLSTPTGLSALTRERAEIADLVRLATSSEYAGARWQPARPGTRQGGGS
jgi:hypothetical protein